jgi:hypothetical protein
MRLDSNGRIRPVAWLPAVLVLTAIGLAGCHRSTLPPSVVPFQSQPALPASDAPVKPVRSGAKSETSDFLRLPAVPTVLQRAEAIALQGGMITDLAAMTHQLAASSFQVQVVPSSSQEKADRIAREWAADAKQLYTIWAYWKLPVFSITRHAYYSPTKGKALKVEFTVSSLFSKSLEEPAEGFDQATLILNEARDRHAVGARDAHAIARRMGYVPNKYGAAVLLDIKTYGPMWVFADMPSQTEGDPVMLVHAETGMVTQGGEVLLLAKYLFQRAGY